MAIGTVEPVGTTEVVTASVLATMIVLLRQHPKRTTAMTRPVPNS
jgi:hypothetical protein